MQWEISPTDSEVDTNYLLEVYLFKDPNEQEIVSIIDKCKWMALNPQIKEFGFDGLAKIFKDSNNCEQLPTYAPAVQEKRPILVQAKIQLSSSRRVIVKMPFTDERVQSILSEKSRQLSKNSPGMIVMDVSNVPGGFRRWPELIMRRLQPQLNRRIATVLISENSLALKKMMTEKKVILHPNPLHSLPAAFLEITKSVT